MTEMLPTIDENGNIFIHGRDEVGLRVFFQGEVTTGRVMYLEIKGQPHKLIPDDPLFPDSRLITITDDQIKLIPASGALYVVRDETDPLAFVRLDGTIRWRGWTQ